MTPTEVPGELFNFDMTACNPASSIPGYQHYQKLLASENPREHPDNKGGLSWMSLATTAASKAASIAFLFYLKGQWDECVEWAARAGDAYDYYFFGDWMAKELYDGQCAPEKWFEDDDPMSWVWEFDMDIPWLAVGRHWGYLDRAMRFPRSAVPPDDSGPAARAYYLGLADWWRDRRDVAGLEAAKSVRGTGSKFYHLLCDIALAISSHDLSHLPKDFVKSVDVFIARRDHAEQFPMPVTLLWNVARHDGLNVELPTETAKFLFEIPGEYWESTTKT